jgi:hypothetical protein
MTRRLPYAFVLATALIGGCAADSGGEAELTPLPATLAGVYSGELPCSNCAAIAATLWLRPDGRFFLRQELRDESAESEPQPAARGPSTTYGLGRWHWDELTAEAILRGAGPERRLAVRDAQRVELKVPSPIEQVLTRDAAEPFFGDRLMLDGESAVTDGGATFTECLTGLVLPVAEAGAYRELRRQHRRMNPRGRVAVTTVEGHLIAVGNGATTSEQLVVDRFITMKPGTGC